ncbi:MAG: hypothetical protein LW852_14605 [Sediminibacterium sp.]|jgi:hypothetical protein|nr:hypothetical protein [Sediminibacterium sp.]
MQQQFYPTTMVFKPLVDPGMNLFFLMSQLPYHKIGISGQKPIAIKYFLRGECDKGKVTYLAHT